jgi:hypothetical protein
MQKWLVRGKWPDCNVEQLIARTIIRANVLNHAMSIQILEKLFAWFDKLTGIAEHSPMCVEQDWGHDYCGY